MESPDPRHVRQLLVERARARKTAVRSAGILALDDALTRLAALDAIQARIVELRYFGAFTIQQTANAIGASTDTVVREWTMARAWLKRAIDSVGDDSGVLEL